MKQTPRPRLPGPDWCWCTPTRISDGDTLRVAASLGLGLELHHQPVRLLGIQAPELAGRDKYAAQAARQYLTSLTLNVPMLLHTPGQDRDRYGRLLAWLYAPRGDRTLCINTEMVRAGYAQQWAPNRHQHGGMLPPTWNTNPPS